MLCWVGYIHLISSTHETKLLFYYKVINFGSRCWIFLTCIFGLNVCFVAKLLIEPAPDMASVSLIRQKADYLLHAAQVFNKQQAFFCNHQTDFIWLKKQTNGTIKKRHRFSKFQIPVVCCLFCFSVFLIVYIVEPDFVLKLSYFYCTL